MLSRIAFLSLLLSACGGEDIRVYRVPKESPGPASGAPAAAASESLHWDAPASWKGKRASQMRLASYAVPGPGGEGDLSVIVLPGDAGGELANVNRWRGQIGLAPLDEAGLASAGSRLHSRVGPALAVDFSGKSPGASAPTRMLGAILFHRGRSWFFKLTGPESTVSRARADFMGMVSGVHPGHE